MSKGFADFHRKAFSKNLISTLRCIEWRRKFLFDCLPFKVLARFRCMEDFMKRLTSLIFAAVFLSFGFASATEMETSAARIRIQPSQHTCQEVYNLLRDHRSIWTEGFLGTYSNLAATPAEIVSCSGSRSRARQCRTWTPSLNTQDGVCRVGVRCSCFSRHDDRGDNR